MEFLDDDDRSELNALRDKLHELRGGFHDAKRGGDRAAAHAIALSAVAAKARARNLGNHADPFRSPRAARSLVSCERRHD